MAIIDLLVKNVFGSAVVLSNAQIAPHAFHITIQSDDFKKHEYRPGEHLRLFVGLDRDTALNEKLRTYSIWDFDGARGIVDIAACTHSSGVGAKWVQQAKTGDTIFFKGPTDKLSVDHNAISYLMIGDDSALSHMYAIRRAIPSTKKIHSFMYAAHRADLYEDIDGTFPLDLLELPVNPSDQIISRIGSIKEQLSPGTIAYLGGDARVCKDIGRYLRQELKWDSRQVRSKGFWMPGKKGMD